MFRSRSVLVSLALLSWLAVPLVAGAQAPIQLKSVAAGGLIAANGDSVTLTGTGGLASVTVQTLDTYSGTMELQCATDAAGTAFDTDDEVMLALMGSTTTSTDITDTVGIYQGNISGCTAVKLIATAGFAASDVTVRIVAITPGGGSSGGGGAAGAVSITQGGNTATVNASSQLSVTCANCSGSGVSVLEDAASANGDAGTPAYTVRNNTLTAATGTDGDYQPVKSTAAGATYTAPTYADVPAVAGNGASGTGVQRVTLANDSTGVIATVAAVTTVSTVTNVATIGTSVTPGTAAANLGKAEDAAHTSADVGVMAMGVRTDTAASLSGTTGDYNPFITDVLGKLWTTGSYPEDGAHVDGETGLLGLAVRRDANTSLVGTDGDRAPFQVDATGSLKVAIISGAGSGGTALADNAAFTPATTSFTPIGGEVDDTGTTAATENSAGAARMTVQRAIHVNLRSAAGAELTPSVDVTEDAAETAGGTGPMVMSVRRDTQASSAGTTGDNATVNTDAVGNLWVTGTVIEDAAETAGGQLSMSGSVRRDVLATSAGTTGDNATINTTSNGALWVAQPDPCSFGTKVFVNITQTTGTQLLTGTASNRTYVCAIHLVSATAQNIALVSGTGTVCATGIAGMAGGTTAATGWNLAANGGLVIAGGNSSIAKSAANADNVCLLTSSTGQISGNLVYVVAP